VWFSLSAVLALNTTRSSAELTEFAKLVLPFFVGVTMVKEEKDWRPMLWTIALAQGYVGFEMNLDYLVKDRNTANVGFGGTDNNFFGATLVTSLGPALALMISSKRWYSRGLAAAAAALILHTILLTFSRGAMLGLLAIGVTAFVMMPKRPKNIGALVITAVLAISYTGPELFNRYTTVFVSSDGRDTSAQSRLDLWRDCLRVIGEYPVFGVGPANWRVIARSYGWPAGKSAHSVWMETAAEIGVPGALALVLFFVIAAVKLWPVARARLTEANRYEVILASGVIMSIVGFVVAGQFVSAPGLETPYFVVMLGAAMLKTTSLERSPAGAVRAAHSNPYSTVSAMPLRSLPGARSVAAKR
jgi:O-antigen ligase